ncbi:MAG: DUF2007 domain-containing protein [Anaerolineaceae bacterium]|nr:DUF2007 domain-containing protein [Anaerolineaceae bacterium]
MDSQKKQTKRNLRDLLISHMRTEFPVVSSDLSLEKLNEFLSDYNQFVIEETFAALQGNSDLLVYPKSDELDIAIFESQNPKKYQVQAEIDQLIDYKAQIEKLFILTKKLVGENAESSISETKETDSSGLSVTVYNAGGKLQAEMIRLFLESFGIRSHIFQESAGITYGLTVGPLGLAEIKVSEEDSDQVRIILKAMEEGVFILPEDHDEAFNEDLLVE